MRTPWEDRLPMGLEEEYGGLLQARRDQAPLARGTRPVEHSPPLCEAVRQLAVKAAAVRCWQQRKAGPAG